MSEERCNKKLIKEGKIHPRTCAECVLGPCKYFTDELVSKTRKGVVFIVYADWGSEGKSEPYGAFTTEEAAAHWVYKTEPYWKHNAKIIQLELNPSPIQAPPSKTPETTP